MSDFALQLPCKHSGDIVAGVPATLRIQQVHPHTHAHTHTHTQKKKRKNTQHQASISSQASYKGNHAVRVHVYCIIQQPIPHLVK